MTQNHGAPPGWPGSPTGNAPLPPAPIPSGSDGVAGGAPIAANGDVAAFPPPPPNGFAAIRIESAFREALAAAAAGAGSAQSSGASTAPPPVAPAPAPAPPVTSPGLGPGLASPPLGTSPSAGATQLMPVVQSLPMTSSEGGVVPRSGSYGVGPPTPKPPERGVASTIEMPITPMLSTPATSVDPIASSSVDSTFGLTPSRVPPSSPLGAPVGRVERISAPLELGAPSIAEASAPVVEIASEPTFQSAVEVPAVEAATPRASSGSKRRLIVLGSILAFVVVAMGGTYLYLGSSGDADAEGASPAASGSAKAKSKKRKRAAGEETTSRPATKRTARPKPTANAAPPPTEDDGAAEPDGDAAADPQEEEGAAAERTAKPATKRSTPFTKSAPRRRVPTPK